MNTYRYNTVTEAIKALRKEGFSADFIIHNGYLFSNGKRIRMQHAKLLVVYRYEGSSDPADEATVYGLKTRDGIKGILVTGDGIYAEAGSGALLTTLHQSKKKRA